MCLESTLSEGRLTSPTWGNFSTARSTVSTTFSGTSRHRVEAGLCYSAALIPVMLGLHPVHAVAVILDCGLGAWLSHDGFHWPGSGSYFHILHHRHFDCNYGSSHLPIDWLFGTYVNSKEQVH